MPTAPDILPEQVRQGAQAVAQIDDYFKSLKTSAASLRDVFGARGRGYFTPTEDDQTRQLLVSYWRSRLALLDLVLALKLEAADARTWKRNDAFLVAYGAAILMVDAARFLRQTFGDDPVVVAKLNEPEPHLNIPAGVYDTVQASLVAPINAWHLYHANSYFDAHAQELRPLVQQQSELGPVLDVIERLGGAVRVSAADYAQARLAIRAQQLKSSTRSTLGQALYGLQEAAARLVSEVSTAPTHRPALPQPIRRKLAALLRPGDVLVTRKEFALTNYFLPGYWPHAALYLGTSQELERLGLHRHDNIRPRWQRLVELDSTEPRRVLEALKDGVRVRSVASPFGSDAIAAIRPRLQPPEVAAAIARGFFHEGKGYDFDFDFTRSDRLVCTEVVYRSYEGAPGMRFDLTRRAGRLTLAAEDLLRMALRRDAFELLAVYAPDHRRALLTADDAGQALTATMGRS